ncbi:MAG: toll/interleukin-1 receptor domain-containing protein [Cyanobacteria bacterium P01_D01_bin.115]
MDSDFARKLNDRLQMQGKLTWFDQESIASGADFQQEIYRGIETSDHFLFILSPEAVNSPYCADEVEYSHKLNKRVVTVRHRLVDTTDLHPVLAAVQWIDFRQGEGDFNANFKELLRTLETDRAHLEAHTKLLVKALEWENKQRSDDVLLRGQDLQTAEEWLESAIAVQKDPLPTEQQKNYITKSREVEEARQRLTAAGEKAKRLVRIGAGVLAGTIVIAGAIGIVTRRNALRTRKLAQIEQDSINALQQFEYQQLDALV